MSSLLNFGDSPPVHMLLVFFFNINLSIFSCCCSLSPLQRSLNSTKSVPPVHFCTSVQKRLLRLRKPILFIVGLILTEGALYSTDIATENSLIEPEIDADTSIVRQYIMGSISIEQYRSRIGSHDGFVKTKALLSRLIGRFWNIMFMMLYLNVFYLPTLKQVVGQ